MAGKLRCYVCGEEHKARSDKFPNAVMEQRRVKDPEHLGQYKMEPVVIGHICKKCTLKGQRAIFMKQHKIKADKTGKKSVREMIREKLDEITTKGIKTSEVNKRHIKKGDE
jgi:hypothetical protein